MNEEFFALLDRAVTLANAHEKQLLSYPGVIGVGAGPERREGRLTGQPAIVVTVRRKKSREDLEAAGEAPLPEEIEGIAVDVEQEGAAVEAPEIRDAQERAREVLQRERDRWLRTPNITGIGIGYKKVGGQMDFSRIALKFFVRRKLSADALREQNLEPIPAEIDGVPTDVEEMREMRPTSSASGSRDDRKDPLTGGITVGVNTKPFWYGTLGSIVFDVTTGESMVLSNQHVLDGPAGTDVVQPSPIGLDDSLDIGFQLNFCNPADFFRLDTPNTTVGTVLAGAAAAAALAAALSDEIDPTRRGQEATVPPAGARTLEEVHEVRMDYGELPIPGTHFKVDTAWKYSRRTDSGVFTHSVSEVKENPHVLLDQLLLTDRKLYHPGGAIRLYGLILPERCAPRGEGGGDPRAPISEEELHQLTLRQSLAPATLAEGTAQHSTPGLKQQQEDFMLRQATSRRCPCDHYHVTAILTPTSVDRAFPVVLHEPPAHLRQQLYVALIQLVRRMDDRELLERVFRFLRFGCFYTGLLPVENLPLGPWKHYLFVQTANFAPEGADPLKAAKVIGGLPVSRNMRPVIDIACGPFVVEDGQFDIELL